MSTSPKRFGCLGVFIVFLLCLSILFNALFLIGGAVNVAMGENTFHEVLIKKPAQDVKSKIAVIRLDGLITGGEGGTQSPVDIIKTELKQAIADGDVRAIVLAIDSPGGEVTASDIIYNAVKEARKTKPVVVSMGSLAASGGYYVAVGGSHIFAHETTFTGSIGVIMQSLNYSDMIGKIGVQVMTYKSGNFKDMLSGSRPPTEPEKQYIQGMVMQTYDKFVGIVAAERKLPVDELRNGVADGRVVSGKDALAAKLVDEIGDFDAAVQKAMQLAAAPGAAVVGYDTGGGLAHYLRMLGKSETPKKIEINLTPEAGLHLQPGRLYLLPSLLAP